MFELNKLYHVDCMEAMKEIPDKYFELAIVDPPYGINAPKMSMGTNKNRVGDGYPGISTAERIRKGRLNSGGGQLKNRALNTMNCNWDDSPPPKEYFDELFRVSKNQMIFGGNYFELSPTRGIGAWDKCQPWENFSQFELIWTSFDCPAFIIRYSNTGGNNNEQKIHPCQKPVAVYSELLRRFAKTGDKILDTHVGSASSLIACYRAGYNFMGFEIDKEYYEKANERLLAEQQQINLFTMPSCENIGFE